MTSADTVWRTAEKNLWLGLVGLALLVLAVAGAFFYYASGPLNHDSSYLIVATDRWLRGAVLYRDIMETNPPLIFYWTAPAVLLSRALSLDASTMFVALTCGISLLSIVWCWTLLSRAPAFPQASKLMLVVAMFVALLVIPGQNFAQREQIFVIATLPYFFAKLLRHSGINVGIAERVFIGLFAVLGFSLKPFFLLPALFAIALACWQEKNLRSFYEIDNVVLWLGSLFYAAFVAIKYPQYYADIVPIELRTYAAITSGGDQVLDHATAPLLLVVAVATLGEKDSAIRKTLLVLSAILAGFLAAYVLQRKGWPYHLLPFEMFSIIACLFSAAFSTHDTRSRPLHFVLFAVVPILLLVRVVYVGRYDNIYEKTFSEKFQEITSDWRGKSIALLSTDVYAAFPLINELGAEWAGRYPYQWIVAGVLDLTTEDRCVRDKQACDNLRPLLDYARQTNVDDFVMQEPDVVLVDNRTFKSLLPAKPFDYIDFLKQDRRFSKIWQHYTKFDSALDYDIWLRNSRVQ